MFDDYLKTARESGEIDYFENSLLIPYSSFGIGGTADYIILPKNKYALISLLDSLDKYSVRYKVFGNGTNVLFSDNGFRGAVIFTKNMQYYSFNGEYLTADSGCMLAKLSRVCASKCLSGLEFACGIPGTLGGALYMNAGAYGCDMSMIVSESEYIDSHNKLMKITDHEFSYRHSVYSHTDGIITSCIMKLVKADENEIKKRMAEYTEKRKSTQPYDKKSAGSTFKRTQQYITAKLIDDAGLKGFSVGGASVSEKHAGFIVNNGGASSRDVLEVISIVKQKVYEKFGVMIECEIIIVDE